MRREKSKRILNTGLFLTIVFLSCFFVSNVFAAEYCEDQDKNIYYTASRSTGCNSGDQGASEFTTHSTDLICCKKASSSGGSSSGSSNSSGSKTDFENMEKIPGQKQTSDLVEYLNSIYTFGIAISAILAIFMITLGGFSYIVMSAGNASKASNAKDMIFSAIYGLILALVAWLMLFVINPDLIEGTLTGVKTTDSITSESGKEQGSTGGTSDGYTAACSSAATDSVIDFSKATEDSKIKLSSGCDSYSFSNSSGVDECILRAIAQKESSCGSNKKQSSAGACGLMQIKPETAQGLGYNVSCQDLIDNDALSIEIAAKYIGQNQSTSCVTSAKNDLSAIFAGYNSGYGCGSGSCPNSSGKKSGLCPSSDCSGSLAFECCLNPGELDQTIDYSWNTVGYYNQCKGN